MRTFRKQCSFPFTLDAGSMAGMTELKNLKIIVVIASEAKQSRLAEGIKKLLEVLQRDILY